MNGGSGRGAGRGGGGRATLSRRSFRSAARPCLAVIGTTASLWWWGATPAHALCPNCLGQNASWTPTLRIVGVFLLIPPAIFFVVARLIRRLDR